jgi:RNA polymerase sigma-70 factor (ECF subfamily)
MRDKDSIIFLESRPILASKLMECFKKLVNSNQKYARVLNLRYQGYSSDEVSQRLEIDVNNLYIILHRARKALLSCLKEEGDSDE